MLGALLYVLVPVSDGQAVQIAGKTGPAEPPPMSLPDAPGLQTPSGSPTPNPNSCPPGTVSLPGGKSATKDADPVENGAVHPAAASCANKQVNWYQRFANGPKDKPLTGWDKGWLAARNLVDPFNLMTIGGEAAIAVAADPDSPYGPGMPGYARNVGVSFTQAMTGEFFGTFVIPAVTHQDPHYYRMEKATIRRRIGHALVQVIWTQGDSGKMMPNYANLAGFAIEDEISNLYVPGRRTDAGATAARYATALALAPTGNFINEFVPDLASRVHVQIVVLQRIINQVAQKETMNSTGGPSE